MLGCVLNMCVCCVRVCVCVCVCLSVVEGEKRLVFTLQDDYHLGGVEGSWLKHKTALFRSVSRADVSVGRQRGTL